MLSHPDKLRNCEDDPDKVYIANRCFAAITEAYNIFKVCLIIFYALINCFNRKRKVSNDSLNDELFTIK